MEQKNHHISPKNTDLEVLKRHFPQCFTKEGTFDFEKFKAEIAPTGENLSRESYGLHWLGKSYARLLATDKATTFLTEDTAHNSLPENQNAENLLLKGDNLEVLKHLSNAYHQKIKMIYIDPPYNTGSDGFVYQDDRKFTAEQLQKLAGIEDYEAERILEFTQSKSNSHSAWLTFMYPRLYIAKRLLTDDGVIFISIDDNEVAQLRLLCDEIFGEENFVAEIPILSNPRGRQSSNFIAETHEYVLIYSKHYNFLTINGERLTEKQRLEYNLSDENGNYRLLGLRLRGGRATAEQSPTLHFPIYYNINDNTFDIVKRHDNDYEIIPKFENGTLGTWRWSKEKILHQKGELIIKKVKDRYDIFQKDYLTNDKTRKIKSLWDEKEINYDNATRELKNLGLEKTFNYAKPIHLIKKIISISTQKDDLILDFFAGSGTTADAVMQLNREDGGNRKFILVQLPEPIDPKKSKTAYDFVKNELGMAEPTIFDITKERIIRSSTAVSDKPKKEELFSEEKPIATTGFKIFATTPIWDNYDEEFEDFDEQLQLFDPENLTETDIFTLLTTWKTYDGIPLTLDLEKVDLGDYTAYYSNEKLYLMNKSFSTENLKSLVEKIDHDKDFNPLSVVVFGHHFESKTLRELTENLKNYNNKKQSEENISVVVRY